jgi:SAM-dependent methyltransferase
MSDRLDTATDSGCCSTETEPTEAASVSRDQVRDYYAAAAQAPQEQLCCPTSYNPVDVSHIPEQVLEISYGCGSPMGTAKLMLGDTVVDLGSGGGIDCFIAAKQVGENGRVIGVDMTDDMLAKATGNADQVAANLGYQVVSFKKGYLEAIPVGDGEANLVTSNCVLNLSTDKSKVFAEIHRVLKHGGRFVISDIVSDQDVPESMRQDKELWGECLSGAMTEREFVLAAESAGFYGITLDREYLWQEVNGIRFYSTTFWGYRFDKGEACCYQGHTATYLGPGSSMNDDDGHTFPRGEAVEVCTDTAAKLSAAPYCGDFVITEPDGSSGGGGSCC